MNLSEVFVRDPQLPELFEGFEPLMLLEDFPFDVADVVTLSQDVRAVYQNIHIHPGYRDEFPTLVQWVGDAEILAVYGIEQSVPHPESTAYLLWANGKQYDPNLVLNITEFDLIAYSLEFDLDTDLNLGGCSPYCAREDCEDCDVDGCECICHVFD